MTPVLRVDTDEEALKFRDWYVNDMGDWEAINNLVGGNRG